MNSSTRSIGRNSVDKVDQGESKDLSQYCNNMDLDIPSEDCEDSLTDDN